MRYLLTSLLCVLTLSLTAQVDCPNPYDGNGDGNVSIGDFLEMLAVFGDTDTDSDGVWDSLDYCVDLAACNYANDPSEPCAYIDVLGVCGGGCEGDGDDDGICDSEDDCVGVLDECGVCNGPGPTEVIIDDITILYDSVYLPQLEEWYVYEFSADTTFSYTCAPNCGDLVSHDGYDYSTVLIGDQCWFAENCRYLPEVSPSSEGSETEPYYYVYGYHGTDVEEAQATANYATYGVLYNWPAVMTEGICPSGWHIPSEDEFTQLTDFLGGEYGAGYQMKSSSGWNSGDNGSNSSGFNALPGGLKSPNNTFIWLGNWGGIWSSSDGGALQLNEGENAIFSYTLTNQGIAARCIIDYTDECGVINGDNSTCTDCCGVVNGDGTSCDGACGACNDDTSCLDACGVPNGDGSTCVFESCGDQIGHGNYPYSTVQIGEQCWFSENCRYLPVVSPSNEGNETDPYYYVYGYEGTDVEAAKATDNYDTYGVLYNWPAVMTEGICPSGWHIPSDEEFTQLTDFLGGEGVAGDAMKSTSGWENYGNGSNSSGFTGLPGGRKWDNSFQINGNYGYWWSSSESSSDSWFRTLTSNYDFVERYYFNRLYGFSTRCIIDYTDECGVLNGDNSTCLDECGVPNGNNSTCLDECGVPNGDNSTCLDECGVLNGDNSTCLDECGVLNGDNSTCLDECGVPYGDNSTCAGCDGILNYVVSHEGYDYSTVQIGDQCWFSENCRYLPQVSPNNPNSQTSPYYYVYGYEGTSVTAAKATANYATYGVLYNWPAVMTDEICPSGWHVPSDGEWQTLEMSLGMSESEANNIGHIGTDEGYQMKSTSGWNDYNGSSGNGSNSSGFTGLPGGSRYSGGFTYIGTHAHWWTSSESGQNNSWYHQLHYTQDNVYRNSGGGKSNGFSARCVRD